MREPTHISSVVLGVLVFPLCCIIVERVEHLAILSINIYDITELSFFYSDLQRGGDKQICVHFQH